MAFNVAGVSKTFFNTVAVTSKVPPAIRKALSKFGAFTRRTAKSSLKYGDKPSRPGKPPTVHRSKAFTRKTKSKGRVKQQPASPLRELIFFGYDEAKRSVVIGPALGGSHDGAPAAMEHGGANVITTNGVRKTVRFAARPFMQPAFDKELGGAAGNLKNLVR